MGVDSSLCVEHRFLLEEGCLVVGGCVAAEVGVVSLCHVQELMELLESREEHVHVGELLVETRTGMAVGDAQVPYRSENSLEIRMN